jgi:superfamily II DNA helicase RecQ
MDRTLAIKVLSTLAQGIDPATGEYFPVDSLYHRTDIIRTLFYASECLQSEKQPFYSSEGKQAAADTNHRQAARVSTVKKTDPMELIGPQIELFEKLRKWRFEQARLEGVSAYMVLSNDSLSRIAAVLPGTSEELSRIKGFGEVKLLKYSELILNLLRDFKPAIA